MRVTPVSLHPRKAPVQAEPAGPKDRWDSPATSARGIAAQRGRVRPLEGQAARRPQEGSQRAAYGLLRASTLPRCSHPSERAPSGVPRRDMLYCWKTAGIQQRPMTERSQRIRRKRYDPLVPRLYGTKEAATYLGISGRNLTRRLAHGQVIPPVAELAATPVWSESQLDKQLFFWRHSPPGRWDQDRLEQFTLSRRLKRLERLGQSRLRVRRPHRPPEGQSGLGGKAARRTAEPGPATATSDPGGSPPGDDRSQAFAPCRGPSPRRHRPRGDRPRARRSC
jgi:hypothetical protein